MGVMSTAGTVRAHPLQKSRHILYTFSLPVILPVCRSISEDCAVVDNVPHGVADLLESDVLALERIAQEVLTGESEGPAAAHSPDFEVAGVLRLPEAT